MNTGLWYIKVSVTKRFYSIAVMLRSMATMEINNHDIVNIVRLLEDVQNELLRSDSAGIRTGFLAGDSKTACDALDKIKQRMVDMTNVYLPATHGDQKNIVDVGGDPATTGPNV